jgi:hypothetical protein
MYGKRLFFEYLEVRDVLVQKTNMWSIHVAKFFSMHHAIEGFQSNNMLHSTI